MIDVPKTTTARRLAEKRGVQGTNADVHKKIAYRIKGSPVWHVPWVLEGLSKDDKNFEKLLEEKREKAKLFQKVIDRAKEAGLSDNIG